MKDSVRDSLKQLFGASGNKDVINQIFMVLDLPDEQFDPVYPKLKESLKDIKGNVDMQREIISTSRQTPIEEGEVNEARELIKEFIAEINNDETLSPNKKDMLVTLIEQSMDITFDLAQNPRERIGVKIQLINEDAKLPEYAHDSDAGADIFAVEETVIPPHQTAIIKTGIKVAIPAGYEIQIRPRSGLSFKTPLRIANAPGTIDANYRGEVGVIMTNTGNLTQTIAKHDKIAQMVIAPVPMIIWETVDSLDETDRGEGGFGSTDKS